MWTLFLRFRKRKMGLAQATPLCNVSGSDFLKMEREVSMRMRTCEGSKAKKSHLLYAQLCVL